MYRMMIAAALLVTIAVDSPVMAFDKAAEERRIQYEISHRMYAIRALGDYHPNSAPPRSSAPPVAVQRRPYYSNRSISNRSIHHCNPISAEFGHC